MVSFANIQAAIVDIANVSRLGYSTIMLDTRLAAVCKRSPLPKAALLHTGMKPATRPVHSREWATFSCTGVRRSKTSTEARVHRVDCGVGASRRKPGVSDYNGQVENLGRWRDPKDALRRAVTSQWSTNSIYVSLHV